MADIRDFGEKIGGARKDLWAGRGLVLSDLTDMTELERQTHVKKDNVWPRPDWVAIVANGTPQSVAYWQNEMRKAIPPNPPGTDEESQQRYVDVVSNIRQAVMAVEKPHQIDSFYKSFLHPMYLNDSGYYAVTVSEVARGIINNRLLKAAQANSSRMEREAKQKLFAVPKDQQAYVGLKNRLVIYRYDGDQVSLKPDDYSPDRTILTLKTSLGYSYSYIKNDSEFGNPDNWEMGTFLVYDTGTRKPIKINFETREKAEEFVETFAHAAQIASDKSQNSKDNRGEKSRKKAFVPPQLKHIQRTGPNYRGIRSVNGDMFLKDLKFRGGEFGNWLNDNDRQQSLNMAYDALRDLARLLQVRPEDISFDGQLAIAFGARGRGGAKAHYEPGREVINLTKMAGAGCLAHEWGHALDHAIGRSCGMSGLGSEGTRSRLPQSFQDLLSALRYKTVVVPAGEISAEQAKKIEHSKKNLMNWIKSIEPRQFTDETKAAWDDAVEKVLASVPSITGVEYVSFGRRSDVQTCPAIEHLSQLRKSFTGHVIPRDTKHQIVLWAREVNREEQVAREAEPTERRVKTDFYTGSIKFDSLHSRDKHGYWQSECEMFARAFDCYIADKIRDAGVKSDYLSAYADSFVIPGDDGAPVAAIPLGEERAIINEKFDRFFEEVKELGILRDFVEPEVVQQDMDRPSKSRSHDEEPPKHFEQLSLDDQLFAAEAQRQTRPDGRGDRGPNRER